MISAFFHKIWAYTLMLVCQLSSQGCAYGAVAVEAPIDTPSQLNIKLPAGFKISIFSQLFKKVNGENIA